MIRNYFWQSLYGGQGTLERISWEEWFEKFEKKKLAFLYQDTGQSRFSKLVSRASVKDELREPAHH